MAPMWWILISAMIVFVVGFISLNIFLKPAGTATQVITQCQPADCLPEDECQFPQKWLACPNKVEVCCPGG